MNVWIFVTTIGLFFPPSNTHPVEAAYSKQIISHERERKLTLNLTRGGETVLTRVLRIPRFYLCVKYFLTRRDSICKPVIDASEGWFQLPDACQSCVLRDTRAAHAFPLSNVCWCHCDPHQLEARTQLCKNTLLANT